MLLARSRGQEALAGCVDLALDCDLLIRRSGGIGQAGFGQVARPVASRRD